jgi:hypothetical protein
MAKKKKYSPKKVEGGTISSKRSDLYEQFIERNDRNGKPLFFYTRKGLRSYSKKTGHYFLVSSKTYLKEVSSFIQYEFDNASLEDKFIEQFDSLPFWKSFTNWVWKSKGKELKNFKPNGIGFRNNMVVDFSTMEISTHDKKTFLCSGIDVDYTSNLPKEEAWTLIYQLFFGTSINIDGFLLGEYLMMLKMALLRKTNHNIAFCVYGGSKPRRNAVIGLIQRLVNDDMLTLDLNGFLKDLKKKDVYLDAQSVSVLVFPEIQLEKITSSMSGDIERLIDNKSDLKDVLLIFSTEDKITLPPSFWQKQVLFIPLETPENEEYEKTVNWSNILDTIFKDAAGICNFLAKKH